MLLRNLEEVLARSGGRTPEGMVIVNTVASVMDAHRTVSTDVAMPILDPRFLTDICEAQDRTPTVSRFSEDTGYIHASALVDLCPRQYALARQHDVVVHSSPMGAMRIVWEIGLALERHVVRQLASSMGTDDVSVGVELHDDEYMVVGRPDVVVNAGNDTGVVVETKSMNARDFEELERPLANHVLQAALYRWLLHRRPHARRFRVHDHVILLYVAKDFRRGGVYKEFHVDTSTILVQNMLRVALGLALDLAAATARNGVPARTVCDRQDCARARNCPVATLCFNLPPEAR